MMYALISGALMMACFATGVFFVKFWKKTHDRLFIIFAAAFFLLSLERLALGSIGTTDEPQVGIYMIRLSAFILILIGIIDKNRNDSNT